MATLVVSGEEITVGTTAVEYEFDETKMTVTKPTMDVPIHTNASNSGTIQFYVGATPPAGAEAVAADKTRLLTGVENGVKNFWAKGSGAGQKFTVS